MRRAARQRDRSALSVSGARPRWMLSTRQAAFHASWEYFAQGIRWRMRRRARSVVIFVIETEVSVRET